MALPVFIFHLSVPRWGLRQAVRRSGGRAGPEEERNVPQLTVEGFGTVDVPEGKRLVLAIEQDAKVDVLHACGGNARCTTCRVEFIDGEPSQMTEAEATKLQERGLTGVRLSCQILCDHDMTVRAISRLTGSGRPDPGPSPAPEITPPPVWRTA
jgi:ferredoxin